MKAGQNANHDCCGNSIDCHHERIVEHLNKIGVAAAMMGEDVDEAVKSGSCEILYTEVPNHDCLRNGLKDFKKESLESKLQLSPLMKSEWYIFP